MRQNAMANRIWRLVETFFHARIWEIALKDLRRKLAGGARAIADWVDGGVRSPKCVQPNTDFSRHHLYAMIKKHMALSNSYGFSNPFYRCYDARRGSEIVVAAEIRINFASYDYLGLNDHPAVREAARLAIDQDGSSVLASRIVAGERHFHQTLEKNWRFCMGRKMP